MANKITNGRSNDGRVDVCIYACTGDFGSNVARLLCEFSATEDDDNNNTTTLLLAGRNPSKVTALYQKLLLQLRTNLKSSSSSSKAVIQIQVYAQAVHVDDAQALYDLACRTRVLVNCIKTDAHPRRAMEWIANACMLANTHYVDLAVSLDTMLPIYHSSSFQIHSEKTTTTAKIVPACSLDYAYFGLALVQAELAFANSDIVSSNSNKLSSATPKRIEMIFAFRPGPLGFKWPVNSIETYFRHKQQAAPVALRPELSFQLPTTTTSGRKKNPFLSYCCAAKAWTVPWFIAKDAIQFLFHQRQIHVGQQQVDVRLALPGNMWKAAFCFLYGLLVASIYCPLLVLAFKVIRMKWLQTLLLEALPMVSLGLFTTDLDEMNLAMKEIRADLYIVLTTTDTQSGRDLQFVYQVSAPSIHLHHECTTIAALELAKCNNNDNDKDGPASGGGVLTPAQALQDTNFWDLLRQVGDLEEHVQILEK